MKSISEQVHDKLRDASDTFISDVICHGIHNLTNDYNNENAVEFDREFNYQANQILNGGE